VGRFIARIRWMGVWLGMAVGCLLYSVLLIMRVGRYRLQFRHERATLARMPFDVVAKTWCFPSTPPAGEDFYYGDLHQRLARRNLRLLFLCGGPEDLDWPRLVNHTLFASRIFRIPLWCLVPWFAPIRLAVQQVQTSLRVRWMAGRPAGPLVRQAVLEASLACLSRATMRAGVYVWIGRAVVDQWHRKGLSTLYEGNSWENCLWWGAKSVDPRCRTVGYQHTVFFQESLALMRPVVDLPARSVPDVVLCLGQESAELMRQAHEPSGVRLLRFGGFRCRPGSRALHRAPASRRTVLVTPEGTQPEVLALFRVTLACARQLPAYRFILRCHPNFPMARAQSLIPGLSTQPNVAPSEQEHLDQDLTRASVLLYRGSSSVLYAIAQGLLPVCVHVAGLLDVDPLFRLSQWRVRCTTPEEFAAILQWYEHASSEQLEAEWKPAADYVAAYTQPVEERAIDEFVRAVGLDAGGPA